MLEGIAVCRMRRTIGRLSFADVAYLALENNLKCIGEDVGITFEAVCLENAARRRYFWASATGVKHSPVPALTANEIRPPGLHMSACARKQGIQHTKLHPSLIARLNYYSSCPYNNIP